MYEMSISKMPSAFVYFIMLFALERHSNAWSRSSWLSACTAVSFSSASILKNSSSYVEVTWPLFLISSPKNNKTDEKYKDYCVLI